MRLLVRPLWATGLSLTFVLSVEVCAHSPEALGGQLPATVIRQVSDPFSAPLVPQPPASGNPPGGAPAKAAGHVVRWVGSRPSVSSGQPLRGNDFSAGGEQIQITHHVTGFYDDRSLDVAITVEQVCTWYLRYKVRLQLPNGAKQSLAVMAPAGGLQPEVRDMTGDGIQNDLVLTPALFPWFPTVLVNDGHDHFAVSKAGASLGFFTSSEDPVWRAGDVPATAAWVSSGFHAAGGPAKGGGLFLPQLKGNPLVPTAPAATCRLGHRPSSERAPPVLVAEI